MMVDSRHREKTFKIEKKLSESRKKIWNPEKYFRVKKIYIYEIEKKIQNREKYFKIEKIISESRKLFQNREKCFRIEKYFATRIEKKILNSMTSHSMNFLANICLFKVNNRNTRKRCEICSKLIIKTPERRH